MKFVNEPSLDLTILMPCRNEEGAVGISVAEALSFIRENGLLAEVLVIDNNSTDLSVQEALKAGAVTEHEGKKGYGAALIKGISLSKGKVIIFGDCDTTYDFYDLNGFYEPLKTKKYDIMIGNRLNKNAQKGAMKVSHLVGVKVLSWLGRLRYGTDVSDFHCGLRGLTRQAAQCMELKAAGMEFATEFIGEAVKKGLSIGQTDIVLRKSRAPRRSKLKPVTDAIRHLRLMFGR
ncbi:MAG: glycosyltransferase family 2 protein [Lachnospiraceae bacterium]|nr:glycosyltransferase family 2 protein [Lachnospiraceae bacterium]